jgi:hypothetical protein
MMNSATRQISAEAAQYEDRVARAIAEEELHQDETIEHARRLFAAGDEPGFTGDLRRAIHSGGVPLEKLATVAEIDVFHLCNFLEGTADLTSGQIQRLVNELGLQLVRPIPPTKPSGK